VGEGDGRERESRRRAAHGVSVDDAHAELVFGDLLGEEELRAADGGDGGGDGLAEGEVADGGTCRKKIILAAN